MSSGTFMSIVCMALLLPIGLNRQLLSDKREILDSNLVTHHYLYSCGFDLDSDFNLDFGPGPLISKASNIGFSTISFLYRTTI